MKLAQGNCAKLTTAQHHKLPTHVLQDAHETLSSLVMSKAVLGFLGLEQSGPNQHAGRAGSTGSFTAQAEGYQANRCWGMLLLNVPCQGARFWQLLEPTTTNVCSHPSSAYPLQFQRTWCWQVHNWHLHVILDCGLLMPSLSVNKLIA